MHSCLIDHSTPGFCLTLLEGRFSSSGHYILISKVEMPHVPGIMLVTLSLGWVPANAKTR